jgi:acetyltransferase-like isoleucine patch superfamily enzyme
MRNPLELVRYSSFRFLVYRVLQQALRSARNLAFAAAWRGSLGACGKGTRIDAGVTLVLPKNIRIGERGYIAERCQLTTEANDSSLAIGDDAVIGADTRIDYTGSVRIGHEALVSEGVRIYTHDHDTWNFEEVHSSSLEIGDHVWLGARAIILPSVTRIGSGAVIGAGSVVTKNVESGAVVAGNPARVVGKVGAKTISRG